MGEQRKKKFEFTQPDGSVLGHGKHGLNLIRNMESSGQLEQVSSTRKPFDERFNGIGRLRVSS